MADSETPQVNEKIENESFKKKVMTGLLSAAGMPLATNLLVDLAREALVPRTTQLAELSLAASERLEKAREAYQELAKNSSMTSPLEIKRQEVRKQLADIRAKVTLRIANQELLLRMLTLIQSAESDAYESKFEQQLGPVESVISQLHNTLNQYEDIINSRRLARIGAILFSSIALLILAALIWWGTRPNGPRSDYVLPIVEVPFGVLVWSSIGSFTSILYRFNTSDMIELHDPMRWLFTRPATGIVMGIVIYFALRAGLMAVVSDENSISLASDIFLLAAFIAGFSDQLADRVLRTLAGRFGGDPQAELIKNETTTRLRTIESLLLGLHERSSRPSYHNDEDAELVNSNTNEPIAVSGGSRTNRNMQSLEKSKNKQESQNVTTERESSAPVPLDG